MDGQQNFQNYAQFAEGYFFNQLVIMLSKGDKVGLGACREARITRG